MGPRPCRFKTWGLDLSGSVHVMRIDSPGFKALAFVLLVVTFVVASGCSDTETVQLVRESPTPTPVAPVGSAGGAAGGIGGGAGGGGGSIASGSIYVSSVTPGGRSILRFNVADTLNVTVANVAPRAQIQGPTTQLRDLAPHLEIDRFNNRLYVLDTARVLVFDNASAITGDVAPNRVIFLNNLIAPASIAIDTSRDLLYVADFSANNVAVFENASTINTTPTATRTIDSAGIDGPREMFLDQNANRLYIANSFRDNVASFDSASGLSGSVSASRVVSGTQTSLAFPFSMAVDNQGQLFVGNRSTGTITVYAAGASGNVSPISNFDRSQSLISFPAQIQMPDGINLVVADDLQFAVFAYLAPAIVSGVGFPTRIINGSNTQLFFPFGLAVDPNR